MTQSAARSWSIQARHPMDLLMYLLQDPKARTDSTRGQDGASLWYNYVEISRTFFWVSTA